MNLFKPLIGISVGDINGIGPEIVLKAVSDIRILEYCVPIIFCNNKVLNFYRKNVPELQQTFNIIKDFDKVSTKQVNLFNCWEEEVTVTPGVLNDVGGKYAVLSLKSATEALLQNKIQGLVTAPIHKKNVLNNNFNFTGHTPYLQDAFKATDVVMMMVADNFKIALVTEHVPVQEVSKHITNAKLQAKFNILKNSLIKDFGIAQPKIALLGLNPHAGDEGVIGDEEQKVIIPFIKKEKQNSLIFGPYAADAFFARGQYEQFDAVLAMYHDQGLIPFKSLASGEGVNFTAGISGVRTSPDHGTAFDIAGKNEANYLSMLQAINTCVDVIRNREENYEQNLNPLKKMGSKLLNVVDERI